MSEREDIVRQIQRAELDLLKVFQEICERHNLRYFAIGGTCLGAARYQGFIPGEYFRNVPWADDIDVAMPHEDYKKFLEAAQKELRRPYAVFHPLNRADEPLFARMRNEEALSNPEYTKYFSGVCLDIRPLYGLPRGKWRRAFLLKAVALMKRWNFILRFQDKGKGLREKKLILALFGSRPYRYFTLKQNKLLAQCPFDEADEVVFWWRRLPNEVGLKDASYRRVYPYRFPRDIFRSAVKLPFEGTTIAVPVGYEEYLEADFGDLREFPPVGVKVLERRQAVSYAPPLPCVLEPETLKRLQHVELDMLKAFQGICEKHGLRYFAIWGTGIGAVRHHGFIPWDDDLDLAMPYEDFLKFLEIAERELPYPYSVLHSMNCVEEPCIFKLQNEATTYLPEGKECRGFVMDLWVLHGLPSGKWRRKALFRALKFLKHADLVLRFGRWGNLGWGEKLLLKLFKSRPYYYFTAKRDALLRRYPFDAASQILLMAENPLPNERNGKLFASVLFQEDFRSAIKVPFEDTTIPVPVGYDRYLTMTYGDYMTFPPEKERAPKHPYLILDLDRPYREYLERSD